MPETKQVGFQCHAPDQERREFHSRNRVARLPTAWAQEESPPCSVGEATENCRRSGAGGGAPTRERRQNLGQGAPPPPGTHSTPEVPSWPPRRSRPLSSRPAGPHGARHPREQPGLNQALPGGSPLPQVWQHRCHAGIRIIHKPFSQERGEGPAGDMHAL